MRRADIDTTSPTVNDLTRRRRPARRLCKTGPAIAPDGTLTMSNTAGAVCDATLPFKRLRQLDLHDAQADTHDGPLTDAVVTRHRQHCTASPMRRADIVTTSPTITI